jgi:peroxiredoxin
MKFLFITAVSLFLSFSSMSPYGIGDKVADFTLRNVDGKMISLSDYTGKGVKGLIVIFDCNTCPYSKAYNERIKGLNKKYAPLEFPVIAINANDPTVSAGDSFEEMISQAKRKNYEFPYLVDKTQGVARDFGATNTPHVFVLKRNGNNFEVAYIGAIDNNSRNASLADKKYVEEAVDALLAGNPVTTQKTKAVGCGIQWKES